MKTFLRVLAILASVFLLVQTVRHAYVRWLEPRTSVLDKYDQPLKDTIATAASLDELVRRYDPVRKEADRVKAERRAADPKAEFDYDQEPFKSESALCEAISSWEERAKEVRALRIYWLVGFIFAATGLVCYLKINRWLGVTLLIVGFSEAVYWTSPSFLGTSTQEFDRLLVNKLVLSLISLAALGLTIHLLEVFREERQ
jgi:hypothetical protein